MDAFVDAPLRRRNSDASSDRELEEEGLPPDVSNHFGFSSPPHEAFSPTHSTGHMTPGHVVGKPLHDSPKREHVQLPPDVGDNNQNLPDIVNKVLAQNSIETLVEPIHRTPGAEPGIDVRRASAKKAYAHIHEDCEIEVVDYGAEHVKFRQYNNQSFLEFLKTAERNPPMKVRWINVGGISWDVLSELAIKYSLHPLSIEDVLHSRSTSRSKADYYSRHLFCHVLCHAITAKKTSPLDKKYFEENPEDSGEEDEDSETDVGNNTDEEETDDDNKQTLIRRVTRRRRRQSRQKSTDAEKGESSSGRSSSLRWTDTMMLLSSEGRKRQARLAKLNALKKRDRVKVVVSNAFFFLFKDGTLISMHQGDRAFGNQIYQRLLHPDTVLRKDPEASLLLHALIDLVVDQAVQVVDKYSDKINESETQVLLKPNMNVVRSLHILSADLTLRKRTMQPLKSMIYGLRRFDVDRTAAAMGGQVQGSVQGYMTPKTKVYLSDVSDHLETALSSLDQFSTMTDNLIDFVFNMNANATNEQMKRMTIIMCIFLPLTFATGYFGMNFHTMPIVQEHSDSLFWIIVLPVMAVVLPWSLWGDIHKWLRRIGSMRLLNRVEQKQTAKVQSAQRAERKRRQTIELQEKGSS